MHPVRNGGITLEDDWDRVFRYIGRPRPSIRSIDRSGRVIYVSTFSKALFPALRLGYLILPPALVGMFRNAIALMVRSVPEAMQMALANFIADGHFASHLRRMRELYANRRQDFLQMAQATGAGLYEVDMPDTGMNPIAWLKAGQDDRALARQAAQAGFMPVRWGIWRSAIAAPWPAFRFHWGCAAPACAG